MNSGYGGMYIRTNGAAGSPFYGYATPTDACWTYLQGTTGSWHFYHDANRLTITSAGDVGIGDETPSARLEVVATATDGIVASTIAAFSYGVQGTGTSAGVRGISGASNGYGVYGSNNTTGGEGVRGSTSAAGAAGVAGYGNFGTGVYGQSLSGGYGVYGTNAGSNSTGHAGYFNGRVHVAGALSKSSGSFKIDHPLDPANKYLYHSFVESPDMLNIYNGTTTTDAQGYATVGMPEWFEALNREFRYQLTVIDAGEDFVLAKVAREIEGNSFVIRTSRPQTKVSWQVTGVRQDAYAEANRIQVEEMKPEAERGRYLHPEVLGLPAELGLGKQPIAVIAEEEAAEADGSATAPAAR